MVHTFILLIVVVRKYAMLVQAFDYKNRVICLSEVIPETHRQYVINLILYPPV